MATVTLAGKTYQGRPATLGSMRESIPLQTEFDQAGARVDRIETELASTFSRMATAGDEGVEDAESLDALEAQLVRLHGERTEAKLKQAEARIALLLIRLVDPPTLADAIELVDFDEVMAAEEALAARATEATSQPSSS